MTKLVNKQDRNATPKAQKAQTFKNMLRTFFMNSQKKFETLSKKQTIELARRVPANIIIKGRTLWAFRKSS